MNGDLRGEDKEEEVRKFWGDMSGEELNPSLVRKAREDEMEEFRKRNVYVKVPIDECIRKTGKKPIGSRWVDINKGDDETPSLCQVWWRRT